MKKILLVLAPDGFQEEEYSDTRNALEKAGVSVSVASFEKGEAIGARGGRVKVDFSVDEVSAGDYDGVAFIGGQGMVGLVGNSDFIKLAKEFYTAGKLAAAICIAPVILANAGILKNKRATVCGGAENEIKNNGGIYTGKSVEVDGNLITADGPNSAEEFGKAIVKLLTK